MAMQAGGGLGSSRDWSSRRDGNVGDWSTPRRSTPTRIGSTGLHVWVRDESGSCHPTDPRPTEAVLARRCLGSWRAGTVVDIGSGPGRPCTPARAGASSRPISTPRRSGCTATRARSGMNLSWSQVSEMLSRRSLLDAERRDELIRLKYGRISGRGDASAGSGDQRAAVHHARARIDAEACSESGPDRDRRDARRRDGDEHADSGAAGGGGCDRCP